MLEPAFSHHNRDIEGMRFDHHAVADKHIAFGLEGEMIGLAA